MRFFIKHYCLVLCVFIGLLAGCSKLPQQIGYKYSQQGQMQSVYHWQVLADDIAKKILSSDLKIAEDEVCFYVDPAEGEFGEAFTHLINAALVNNSTSVAVEDDQQASIPHVSVFSHPSVSCYLVNVSAQVVRYRRDRDRQFLPGTFTLLASGIAVMSNMDWTGAVVVGGVLADFFIAAGNPNTVNSELLVSTSIEKDGRFLFMRNDLYYLHDSDASFYKKPVQRRVKSYPLSER